MGWRCFHWRFSQLVVWCVLLARSTQGYRIDCSGPPVQISDAGGCAHFQGGSLEDPNSPGFHLRDNSKVVFNFRLYGCSRDDPQKLNVSNALSGYHENEFHVYENERLLIKSPTAELAYTVRNQRDYLFDFVTLLLDMSKSVSTSEEYMDDLKAAIRQLVTAILPESRSADAYKLKVQILAFAGGSDRHTVNRVLLGYRCANELVRDLDNLLSTLPHPRSLFPDYKSTALNLAVSSALGELVGTVESVDAEFAAGTLVVFTDGDDTAGSYSNDLLLSEVQNVPQGISLFSVGVGNVTKDKLAAIGKDGYVKITNSTMLQEGFRQVADRLLSVSQNRYIVEYCSPKRKGEHVLQIQLHNQTFGSTCRFFFDASEFEPHCNLGFSLPQLEDFGCGVPSNYYEYSSTAHTSPLSLFMLLISYVALASVLF